MFPTFQLTDKQLAAAVMMRINDVKEEKLENLKDEHKITIRIPYLHEVADRLKIQNERAGVGDTTWLRYVLIPKEPTLGITLAAVDAVRLQEQLNSEDRSSPSSDISKILKEAEAAVKEKKKVAELKYDASKEMLDANKKSITTANAMSAQMAGIVAFAERSLEESIQKVRADEVEAE